MCGGAMSLNKRNRIAVSEGALIAAGGLLGAWFSPQLDSLSIVYLVLLARFRGRIQSAMGAFAFCLGALVSATAKPGFAHSHAGLFHLFAVICAMWICAICVSDGRMDATARPESEDAVHDR